MEQQGVRYRLPAHPRLGRNVNHDPLSRAFRVPRASGVALAAVRHEAFIPVLDQGSLGSCTGNAGVAAVYRRPYVSGVVKPWKYGPDQDGAIALYAAATAADPYPGVWPPEDTGSDGLTIAKVLKAAGIVSGYLWAFTLREAVEALMVTPLITGVPWFNSMFDTSNDGHPGHVAVRQDSGMAGGHEVCVDELVPVGGPDNWMAWYVGGPNSWGTSWGDGGRWYWTVAEWGALLAMQGDVTAFVANTQPAPVPQPPAGDETAAGDGLWKAARAWAFANHVGTNAAAARAVKAWAKTTGRP